MEISNKEKSNTQNLRVLTIPLKVEPWQSDLLKKRMNLCRSIYNDELRAAEKRIALLKKDPSYTEMVDYIKKVYDLGREDQTLMEAEKNSAEYSKVLSIQRSLMRRYELTTRSFNDRAIKKAKEYDNLISTRVAHYTVGMSLGKAIMRHLVFRKPYGYKKKDELHTLISDGRSGIRIVDEENKNLRAGFDIKSMISEKEDVGTPQKYPINLYVLFSASRGKQIKLPIKIDPKDNYIIEGLAHPIRLSAIFFSSILLRSDNNRNR